VEALMTESSPSVLESGGESRDFVADCLLCELPGDKFTILDENDLCLVLEDSYPVSEGHCLIIPRRHAPTFFEMNAGEIVAVQELLHRSKARLQEMDDAITGFNIGMNCGKSGGQSVFHAHVHFIPRRDGDQENPQGGVRKIFPEKAQYKRQE
jgi:diadenosine tetraphosphate (Ap4A) HIT family hydrolase